MNTAIATAMPATLPLAPARPMRIAVVVNYDAEEDYESLRARVAIAPHDIRVFVAGGRNLPGMPKGNVPGRNVIAWLNRQRKSGAFDYAVYLQHPFAGRAEIEDALSKLAAASAPVYYLIPGLNDLLTLGFVALVAYDLREASQNLPEESLRTRLRKTLAPRLPLPVKQAIKDGISSLGLLEHFGFPVATVASTAAPGSVASDGAVRISTQKSVAWVMERDNPQHLPYVHSLGRPEFQKRFFVDDVARYFPMPSTINLVLSNQCNLKCVMCPFHSPLFLHQRETDYFDDKKWMPVSLVERLVEELKDNKQPLIFHMGELDEPMLHPELAKIVRLLARVPNSAMHITSNGNLASEKLSREIIEAGVKSVQFSVDAQTPETYKKIRGAKLEKVQRNVERFLRLRDELRPGLYVNLCIINQEGASGEIEDFKAYWRSKGASSVSVYQLFKPVEGNSAQWVVPNKYYEEKERKPCTALWDQCFIHPQGEVSLCCTTLIRVPQDGIISKGNFNEQPLKEIWFGALYQQVRDDLINNRLDRHKYCADCDNWSSSYQYRKKLEDGTDFVYGESMGYYFFPEQKAQ